MKEYTTYLFDADGTLFDTTQLICDCFQYIAGKYAGIQMNTETITAGIGSPLREQITTHLGISEKALPAVLDDYLQYQLKASSGGPELFPGVGRTLEVLAANGKKLAVVTSRRRYSLTVFLRNTGILDYFDILISPEDTKRHKPHPEPALKAMELLAADKESTVFIGDTHYDISCGHDAGIDTVFVTWSHTGRTSLPAPPTWVIEKMDTLLLPLDLRLRQPRERGQSPI